MAKLALVNEYMGEQLGEHVDEHMDEHVGKQVGRALGQDWAKLHNKIFRLQEVMFSMTSAGHT